MVKISPSSTIDTSTSTSSGHRHRRRRHHQLLGFRMLVVLLFLITSMSGGLSAAQETTSFPRELQDRGLITSRRSNQHRLCDSFSHEKTRSLCNQFRSNRRNRPLPPPPSRVGEIDPRYGVEKRLVPSGPNPLHN